MYSQVFRCIHKVCRCGHKVFRHIHKVCRCIHKEMYCIHRYSDAFTRYADVVTRYSDVFMGIQMYSQGNVMYSQVFRCIHKMQMYSQSIVMLTQVKSDAFTRYSDVFKWYSHWGIRFFFGKIREDSPILGSIHEKIRGRFTGRFGHFFGKISLNPIDHWWWWWWSCESTETRLLHTSERCASRLTSTGVGATPGVSPCHHSRGKIYSPLRCENTELPNAAECKPVDGLCKSPRSTTTQQTNQGGCKHLCRGMCYLGNGKVHINCQFNCNPCRIKHIRCSKFTCSILETAKSNTIRILKACMHRAKNCAKKQAKKKRQESSWANLN